MTACPIAPLPPMIYTTMKFWRFILFFVGLLLTSPIILAAPDEELLGKSSGYPVGNWKNWFFEETIRVGTFSNFDQILPHNTLHKAEHPLPLKRTVSEPQILYPYKGKICTIDDYLSRQRVTGLLIIKDGEILVERYQYDRKATDRFISNSISKSLVSLAVGFALAEQSIRSLDDKVSAYVPQLKLSAYGETSIRNLLRMASGVHFNENYHATDDLFRFQKLLFAEHSIAALLAFNDREAPQGKRFHYASIETHLLALALRAATGRTLSAYLSEKLWQPMGAEADAIWSVGTDGVELAYGYFNATLRDYGRLGHLLANDGYINGKQIVPKDYLLEATDWRKHPRAFAPGRSTKGYGYHFWTLPGQKRRFALFGIYGQAIYVDPESKLVLVQTAVAKTPHVSTETMGVELASLWTTLVGQHERPSLLPAGGKKHDVEIEPAMSSSQTR